MLAGLFWLLVGLGLILGAVLAVLAFPVRLRFDARLGPDGRAKVELGLLGGLAPWITVHDSEKPRQKKPRSRRKRRARKRGPGTRRLSARRLFRAGPELIGGLLAQIRVERLQAHVEFGLGDPADTGQLYGMLVPVALAPGWLAGPRISATLTPVFDRCCFLGEATGALAVTPLRLFYPGICFAWRIFGPDR